MITATNPIDLFLARLEGVRKSGAGWMAKCPVHEDRHASLSVGIGDNGSVLVNCQAKCETKTILAKLGLAFADLYPRREGGANGHHNGNGKRAYGKVVTAYDYPDEHGELLCQSVRTDPKGFFQRRPDGNGAWINNLQGVRRVLYRLPELLNAREDRPDEWRFVVEGEKDVDRLVSLGLIATTNIGGAGKWAEEYSEVLKGSRVGIIVDNDDPGRKHGRQVAESLSGKAAQVRLIELPGLPPKGDVSDWLDAGGTAEQLIGIVEKMAGACDKDSGYILVPGAHINDRWEALEVGNDAFAAKVISSFPAGSLYQRGDVVGELVGDDGQLQFKLIDHAGIRLAVDHHAKLGAWASKGAGKSARQEIRYLSCGRDNATLVLAAAERDARLPAIRLLTFCPVYGPGFVLSRPGFHDGIYYDRPSCLANVEPELDAETIRAVLDDLVVDFPFESDKNRQNFFGAMLTPLIVPAIDGNIPATLINAPLERTGKTKLVELVGGIVSGKRVAPMQLPKKDEETDKRITAMLANAGETIMHLDNISGNMNSAALSSLLTTRAYKGRLLGSSRMVTLPNNLTIFGTGNNVRASGELVKRMVPVLLEPATDHPEKRTDFAHPDIWQYVLGRRPLVLSCLLGAVELWKQNGCPRGSKPMGGFDEWAAAIGGIMQVLGYTEWMDNADEWRGEADTYRSDLRALVEEWAKVKEPENTTLATAAELMKIAIRLELFPDVLRDATDNPTKGQQTAFGMTVLARNVGVPIGKWRVRRNNTYRPTTYSLELLKTGGVA